MTTMNTFRNAAWRLGEYFYGGEDANNAASAVMKELDITAVVNPSGTNEADLVESVTGKVFVAKSPEAFTYDDDGNILSDGRFVYSWDGENRLVSVETSAAAASAGVSRVKVAYTYDNRSRRIGKEVSHFENDTWTVAESRSFVYDGWNMVQEFSTLNSQLSILNSYVWGLDLSGSLQGAGGVGGLLAVAQGGIAYLPCYDGNGNVCEYSSTDGTLVAHYEYSSFGETVIQSGDLADSFTFRFSTKYWESEAKLYYYGYRFYVPESGRWLNRDPIGERKGIKLCQYLSNDPVNSIASKLPSIELGAKRESKVRSANSKNGTATCNQNTGDVDVKIDKETCAGYCVASHEQIHVGQQNSCCQALAAACNANPSQCNAYIAKYNTWMSVNHSTMEALAYTDTLTCYWGALTPQLKKDDCQCYEEMKAELPGLGLLKLSYSSGASLPMSPCPKF